LLTLDVLLGSHLLFQIGDYCPAAANLVARNDGQDQVRGVRTVVVGKLHTIVHRYHDILLDQDVHDFLLWCQSPRMAVRAGAPGADEALPTGKNLGIIAIVFRRSRTSSTFVGAK
jgi:hypothetical protein